MPLAQTCIFVRGVYFALRGLTSRKRTRAYARRKSSFSKNKKLSLVSAHKGKNKGKYIGLEHKKAECLENTAFSEGLTDKLEFSEKEKDGFEDHAFGNNRLHIKKI